MKTLLYILFIILLAFVSCNHKKQPSFNEESAQGTWLVNAFDLDTDYYMPNFKFLVVEFKGDSLYYKDIDDNVIGTQKIVFSKDSVTIDTIQSRISKFKITGDRLDFKKAIAHRTQPSDLLNLKNVEATLVSKYWKNEKGIFNFEEEGKKVIFFPNNRNEYYSHCFEILSYEKSFFLQKKGNQLGCESNSQFIEQILSVSDTEIVTFGFVDGAFKKIRYNSVSEPIGYKPVKFQLCNPYLNKNNPSDRYYYKGTEYKGGLYHIRKIVDSLYKAPKDSKESGIFQVRFVVNCEGKAGMYETQAFDNEYRLKEFSSQISDQIFEITKGLQEWNPGRIQKSNKAIDTYIYLSYKIENGKIIRIYP